ncbi:hypothetical protein VE04_00567, partial [Pseudogymnoascus sp. 24MN13]
MAEALAVVGVVASIVQLLDFGTTVLYRLKEYQSSLGEVPKSFRQIDKELPLLLHTLQQLEKAIDAGSVGIETERALLPVIKGSQEQLELLKNILDKTLPKADDSSLEKGKKAISSLGQDGKVERILKNLRGFISSLTFYYSAASSTLQPLNDAKLMEIRQWLSPPDPSVNYQKSCKQREEDTGLWLLNGEEYTKWKTDAASIIWLYGIAGCGKTILSSTVIQDVFQHCIGDPGKVVAYFYFDFNDLKKQSPELMVRSLICQLSQKCVKIPASLDLLFSSCDNGNHNPSLDSQLDVLHQMIQEYPQCYIILDALDECKDRAELMDIINQISGWQLDNLHVLVTSREEREIQSSLQSLIEDQNTICLESRLVDVDIQKYVRTRLLDDADLRKWQKSSDVQDEIKAALMNGPRGMFRWAACQLDALGKCRNRLALRNSLKTLPPTLDATYDRILCAINEEDSEYAVRILRWLAFSSRPLLLEEVSEVVAIDTNRDPMFDQDEVLEDPSDVLDICSSLITITTTDNIYRDFPQASDFGCVPSGRVVGLAHYSVKEYLISNRSRPPRAEKYRIQDVSCNEFLAISCLGYLFQFDECDLFSCKDIEGSKLAQYASELWIKHAQAAGERRGDLNHHIMSFFLKKNGAYLNWAKMSDSDRHRTKPLFTVMLEDVPTPLYVASLFGWTDIIEQLLSAGANINAQGGKYGNALQAASATGHKKIVELLLTAGANINAQGGRYCNALQAASAKGHKKSVELLLSAGASINARGGEFGNALQAASYKGHTEVVGVLLSKGADVNAEGRGSWANHGTRGNAYYGGRALQLASLGGHEKIVGLLLTAGSDINLHDDCGDALQAASFKGHEKIVRLLLTAGANVNAQGGYYGNALHEASFGGHEKIVRLLLTVGADVNIQGRYSGSALQDASIEGHEEIVRLLLTAGADVNLEAVEHAQYGNALQAASSSGHEKIVGLLLDAGANVNLQGRLCGNALQVASLGGYEKIVGLLLTAGADVNAQDGYNSRGGYFGNALQAALSGGHKEVIEVLLSKGANINAQGGMYDNALQAALASDNVQIEIIKLLLSKGVDVNAQGGRYGNALQAASASHNNKTDIVKLLLSNGADINAQGGEYGNALQAASAQGHMETVELLLSEGANIHAQGGTDCDNALQAASHKDRRDIMKLLLSQGVDVNAQGGYYGNALQAAIGNYTARIETVKLLLSKGANINAQGGYFGNALQTASARCHLKIVEFLLSEGADVNAQGGHYGNALQAAACNQYKHYEIVQ